MPKHHWDGWLVLARVSVAVMVICGSVVLAELVRWLFRVW